MQDRQDKSNTKPKEVHYIRLQDTESACGILFTLLIFGENMSLRKEDVTCIACKEAIKREG